MSCTDFCGRCVIFAADITVFLYRAAGSLMNFFWARRNPASFDMYMFALAAGLLAGEGLGGVLQALLAVAKVDGSCKYRV